MNRHFGAWGLLAVVFAAGFAVGHAQSPKKAITISLEYFDRVEEAKYPWGWIRWLMSSQIDPEAAQTFGIVEILPGQKNTLHMHPNCEELLYVLSGSCEHRVGNKTVVLHAGDLVRIPPKTPHLRGIASRAAHGNPTRR